MRFVDDWIAVSLLDVCLLCWNDINITNGDTLQCCFNLTPSTELVPQNYFVFSNGLMDCIQVCKEGPQKTS